MKIKHTHAVKYNKIPGFGSSHPNTYFVSKKKVGSFMTLFLIISDHYGGQRKACKAINSSTNIVDKMKDGILSEMHAKRILEEYNKLKELQCESK